MNRNVRSIETRITPFANEAKTLLRIIGGGLFLALLAQIRVPLLFTPIPLSLQTFAAMLLGCFLGKREGAMSVVFYLALASAGLPVLSGGSVNSLVLFGLRGGFLLGMVGQAYMAGMAKEAYDRNGQMSRFFLALVASSLLPLVIGSAKMALLMGWKNAFLLGFFPFIVGRLRYLLLSLRSHVLKMFVRRLLLSFALTKVTLHWFLST